MTATNMCSNFVGFRCGPPLSSWLGEELMYPIGTCDLPKFRFVDIL